MRITETNIALMIDFAKAGRKKLNIIIKDQRDIDTFLRESKNLSEDIWYADKDLENEDTFLCYKKKMLATSRKIDFCKLDCYNKNGFCRFFTRCEFAKKFFSDKGKKKRISVAKTKFDTTNRVQIVVKKGDILI